jgi:hypothetical protein
MWHESPRDEEFRAEADQGVKALYMDSRLRLDEFLADFSCGGIGVPEGLHGQAFIAARTKIGL